MTTPCPRCGSSLAGLFRHCWSCGWDSDTGPVPADALKDTRSEDERKRDALPAVMALGWVVWDLEQGFRPFVCRHCGGRIAGGTRVPKGVPDWYLMRNGRACWIEWKTPENTQTPEQILRQHECDRAGIPYRVCRTTEEALGLLEEVARC
jgi:hypothetical protein